MKSIHIALKDLKLYLRNALGLVFMFGIPLLVTGMFYFMFGNLAEEESFALPLTRVVVANLDQGSPALQLGLAQILPEQPYAAPANSLGEMMTGHLQSAALADLLTVTRAPDSASAFNAVDTGTAQLAIILPADLSAQFVQSDGYATIRLYQSADAGLGASVVQSVINQYMDGLSGAKISIDVALAQSQAAGADPQTVVGQAMTGYLLDASNWQNHDKLIEVRSPAAAAPKNLLLGIVGPIMGGMMIFYAFFTGVSTAQSILSEDERGTLPRLFGTPTSQTTILSGKFLSVFMTVAVQVIVLLLAARLIFQIDWGALGNVALAACGIILPAAAFGVMINAFLKNTRQSGPVYGGVLTVTGMIGMIEVFTGGAASSPTLRAVSLFVPQGWAMRGLQQSMNGAPTADLLLTCLVCLAWSLALFAIGAWRFQKRYA